MRFCEELNFNGTSIQVSQSYCNLNHFCILFQLSDNVAEVPYVHSNQHVVGPSKAENKMSHWAVRDVFELQQFSQLPANIAVCRAKVKSRDREVCFFCYCFFFLLFKHGFSLLTTMISWSFSSLGSCKLYWRKEAKSIGRSSEILCLEIEWNNLEKIISPSVTGRLVFPFPLQAENKKNPA